MNGTAQVLEHTAGEPSRDNRCVLTVEDLAVSFPGANKTFVPAVEGVSFDVRYGEILGIVGESGCGKSVTAFSVLRLHDEHTTRYRGKVNVEGKDVFSMSARELRSIRGGGVGFIFQNPMSSLNPLMTIGRQLRETVRAHEKSLTAQQVHDRCIDALEDAGSDKPEEWLGEYPYQMSGGMLQRVVIAMALINKPKLLIADEPTTALDVTIQKQLLGVLKRLRDKRGMSIVLITHDMGVVAQMCDSVAVMYLGEIVESAPVEELFDNPRHPYTCGLLEATPPLEGNRPDRLQTIPGSVPQLSQVGLGCRFASRCPFVSKECTAAAVAPQKPVNTTRCAAYDLIELESLGGWWHEWQRDFDTSGEQHFKRFHHPWFHVQTYDGIPRCAQSVLRTV